MLVVDAIPMLLSPNIRLLALSRAIDSVIQRLRDEIQSLRVQQRISDLAGIWSKKIWKSNGKYDRSVLHGTWREQHQTAAEKKCAPRYCFGGQGETKDTTRRCTTFIRLRIFTSAFLVPVVVPSRYKAWLNLEFRKAGNN